MTDPLEHFGEQQRSFELLGEHGEQLAREAAEIMSRHPQAEPVGLIMEADASEAAELRRVLEAQTGGSIAGFVGIVPRSMALEILRANAPHTLDFLEPVSHGRQRKLPIIAITKSGLRFGAVGYEVGP